MIRSMNPQAEFFDRVSTQWDQMCYHDPVKLKFLLDSLGVEQQDRILDVGTGTGVLIPFLRRYSPFGRIDAIDISSGMIRVAREKFRHDKNARFLVKDIEKGGVEDVYDKIILYSVFPHLRNRTETIGALVTKNLKPGGKLLIAHSQGREALNRMHKRKDESVRDDCLIEIELQKRAFEDAGLTVERAIESDELYYLILQA